MENIFNKEIYNNNIDDVRCMNSAKFLKDLITKGFFNAAKAQTQQEKYYDEKLRQFNGLGIIQVLNILYDVDHYKPPDKLAVNPLFEQCLKYLKTGFDEFADRIIGEDEKNKENDEEIPLKTKFRKIYDVFFYDSFKYEEDLPLHELLDNAKEEISKIILPECVCESYSFEDFEKDLDKIPDEKIAVFVEEHKELTGTIYRKAMANMVQNRLGSEEIPEEYLLLKELENSVDSTLVITL